MHNSITINFAGHSNESVKKFSDTLATIISEQFGNPVSSNVYGIVDFKSSFHDDPQGLAQFAAENREVVEFVANSQKIHAIKVLRSETRVGLKQAKDAVESSEVSIAALRFKLVGEHLPPSSASVPPPFPAPYYEGDDEF